MFLVSVFKAFIYFGSDYKTPIIQLFKLSTHMKCLSYSYVICTSLNNDINYKFRKRKLAELK